MAKVTKEKVLYTQNVSSVSAQFCVAAETKTRWHLLSVACIPHPQRKKQSRTNPQKSWIVHMMLSAARVLGSSVVIYYSGGLGWAPLRLASATLVSAPCHMWTSDSYAHQCLGSCSRTWELGSKRNTSLYFGHPACLYTGEEGLSHSTTWNKALVCDSQTSLRHLRGCGDRVVGEACFGSSK